MNEAASYSNESGNRVSSCEFCAKGHISVATGEVFATSRKIVLRSDGIGSCVAAIVYDPQKKIGAIAHIMLPGQPLKESAGFNTKYARDAVNDLLFKTTRLGAAPDRLDACLVGGGNVLRDARDRLCENVLDSVVKILSDRGIRVVAKAVGGTLRRWVVLDIAAGTVYYTEGDGVIQCLYRWPPDEGGNHG